MSGTTRNKDIFFVIVIMFVTSQSSVNSQGKRSFGESCRFGGHITSFFSQDQEQSRTCDNDMGLICTGTYCACPPGRVWDNGDADRGSPRGCARAVGSPCFGASSSRNQQCVSNANCQFAFCRCKPSFRPNGGHCFSTNDGAQENPQDVRPATGLNFPELQQIFGNYHSQQQNNHQVNSFDDNRNNFNDRFHKGDDNSETSNDRFHNGENFNDRFHNGENVNRFNDRFHSNNGNYHDHQNSRDGSKGSSSSNVRFEE